MRALVAPTDYGWYRFLQARPELREVNFWRPSQRAVKAIAPGELFFFKLKAPYNAIAGFGIFTRAAVLPVWEAWDVFGAANGTADMAELIQRLGKLSNEQTGSVDVDTWISCLAINEPVFFPPDEWVEPPADWHPHLVEMVNAVKRDRSGTERGSFYVNEYGHVIVPDVEGNAWWAGRYGVFLEFDLEGRTIGPRAPDGLSPGDPWPGHRVGVAYTLTAGGRDVYYERAKGPYITRAYLSDEIGPVAAQATAHRVARLKPDGGTCYINEAFELFAPIEDDGEWIMVYADRADPEQWFPEPALPPELPDRR